MRASVHGIPYSSRMTIATDLVKNGLRKLGISYTEHHYDDPPDTDADFAVVWGHKHRCCAIARACALPILTIEAGFFEPRLKEYSLQWNWANRRGIRPTPGSTLRRWPTLKPWHDVEDGRIVVFDQTPNDIQFREVAGTEWAERIGHEAGKFWNREVYVRPHPNVKRTVPIQQDLQSTWLGITYTSSSAINSVAAGVPCVAVDPRSMAYDVCGHGMEDRIKPAREEWAHWLSWTQFTGAELEDGTALRHVLQAHEEAKDKVEEITRQSGLG